MTVLRQHWLAVLAVAVGTFYAVGGAVLNVYGLSYAVARGIAADAYLVIISTVTALGLLPSRRGPGCSTGSAGVRCSSARALRPPGCTSAICPSAEPTATAEPLDTAPALASVLASDGQVTVDGVSDDELRGAAR